MNKNKNKKDNHLKSWQQILLPNKDVRPKGLKKFKN